MFRVELFDRGVVRDSTAQSRTADLFVLTLVSDKAWQTACCSGRRRFRPHGAASGLKTLDRIADEIARAPQVAQRNVSPWRSAALDLDR